MSVKGEIKEGAGFIKEEMNEHGKSPEIVIYVTKAGSKTARHPKRPSPAPAIPKSNVNNAASDEPGAAFLLAFAVLHPLARL
jgi:hypothetical protein